MEPFLGEIRCFAFGQTPQGWLPCNGQTLLINGNQALYALLGTQFGGDGRANFMLPDLRGRVPFEWNQSNPVAVVGVPGQKLGEENVTLTAPQMPMHNHPVPVQNAAADKLPPLNNYFAAAASPHNLYGDSASLTSMAADMVGTAGAGGAHSNMQPFSVVNFCIATSGVFPPRP